MDSSLDKFYQQLLLERIENSYLRKIFNAIRKRTDNKAYCVDMQDTFSNHVLTLVPIDCWFHLFS